MLTFAPINHCNKCKAHAWRELMTGVIDTGEMAEWSIAAVLKTVEGNTSGGSNPSLSASNVQLVGIQQAAHFLFVRHGHNLMGASPERAPIAGSA